MKWSQFFIPTLKDAPSDCEAISHKLLIRAGLVNMLTSGVYTYLPLGLRVLDNIQNIIREEMSAVGANELLLPSLHPLEIWKKTGRDEVLDDVMFKFKDGKGKHVCLGPTHEEIITDIASKYVQSYKQLPITLYQIQTKFRDELRPRYGIVRACEFIMKDAYSFDTSQEGLQKNYDAMYQAYHNVFKRCGLDVVAVEADSGVMGGDVSHEFMVPAAIGEDTVDVLENGKTVSKVAMELGHIFQLGTKYTKPLGANYLDENGKSQAIIMGCYGIGVSRVIAAIVEKSFDESGIIWPKEVAPFDVEILSLHKNANDEEIIDLVTKYQTELEFSGYDVLVDDRKESPGRKFADADLIGIPVQIVVGYRNLKDGKVEIKIRQGKESILIAVDDVINFIKEI
ncbi:MAG: prolyl-tRNA synthetase [Candidatus Omnitrophota bacterium]|jgi:prolyl-tRNA synthetase